MADLFRTGTVTIPAGASESTSLDVAGIMQVIRIEMPDEWTAPEQGDGDPVPTVLTFRASWNGTAWRDAGSGSASDFLEESVAVAPGASVACSPALWGLTKIRLRSGTREAPVPQAAARTITVVMSLPPDLAPTVVVNVPPSSGS